MCGIISQKQTKVLKGIAIWAVVVSHIGQAFHIGVVNPLGPLGVFLFLFLSGYGLSCSYEVNGREKYFQKKLIKVYLPYCIAVILFLIWRLCRNIEIGLSLMGRYLILWSLPQGSYWYLILIFYWYVVFYLLTFCYDNDKILVPFLFVDSVLIIILQGFSRVYVWQFISFPMGLMYGKHNDLLSRWNTQKFSRGGVLLLLVACVCIVLKKMPYVENRELGIADTLLQIGITYSLGIWILLKRSFFEMCPGIGSALAWIGGISYELYLSHVIALDYLKENPFGIRILIYFAVSIISLIILVLCNRAILYKQRGC